MKKISLTCIECPMGCSLEVALDSERVSEVSGNRCPRGKMYAENEVVCPKRVLTTTVRTKEGKILSVKTSSPIERAKIFEVIKKINSIHPSGDIKIGDVLAENISDGADLVAADNSEYL